MDPLRYAAERRNERFEIVDGLGGGFYFFRYITAENTQD
jgi:hypothetical protein